jgi:hypothetical protein
MPARCMHVGDSLSARDRVFTARERIAERVAQFPKFLFCNAASRSTWQRSQVARTTQPKTVFSEPCERLRHELEG